MASITKRGPHQFQAIIRRTGYQAQTKTFETRRAAETWAGEIEAEMYAKKFKCPRVLDGVTLGDALERYAQKVTPAKRGCAIELKLIKRLQRHPLALRPMSSLIAADFAMYRDQREDEVGPNTVRIELALFSHLYSTAIKEWSWPVLHLLRDIRKPSPGDPRERRLLGDEEERLFIAIHRSRCKATVGLDACVRLAIETGMRAGEMLTLGWHQVDLAAGVIRLEMTKNGCKRVVALTLAAVEVLKNLPRTGKRVIPNFYDTSGLDHAFKRACDAAGILDLHFHDLRHEAASRFAGHMHAPELAKTMGWKTLQMAMRYYNPKEGEKVELVRRAERERAKAKAKANSAANAEPQQAWAMNLGLSASALTPTFAIPAAAMLLPTQVTFVREASERVASSAVAAGEPASDELRKAA